MTTRTTKKLLLLNGANINLLGYREPHIYGTTTLGDIESRLTHTAQSYGIDLVCFQSNHEGELVDFIAHHGIFATQNNTTPFDGVLINPAGFTHTSIVLRDALTARNSPFIEIHLSNIHAREPFRTHSYFSDKAVGVICGLGDKGYDMGLYWFLHHWGLL